MWQPSQESDVYIENISDERVQGGHSTAEPVRFQPQLQSRRENTPLASPDNLSDATRPRQYLTDVDSLFEFDPLQAVEQSSQRWSPPGIPIVYDANNGQPIQIQGKSNDLTAATSSDMQWQPESRQENPFDPMLTDFDEFLCTSYTSFESDDPPSQYGTDFNVDYDESNEQSIQPWPRQENYFGSSLAGSNEFPYTSYAGMETPVNDATHPWTAEKPNNMAFNQDSPFSRDQTDFNFQHQPVGENEYPQPGNGQVLPRSDIPSSGVAGPSTSSTTTISPAQSSVNSATWPHLTADAGIKDVGSSRIRQASASRRKKDGIHRCMFGNCTATFTEPHNLQYHHNSHIGLKPYKCSNCTYAAASPSTLGRHRKVKHQNVQAKP